MFTILATATSLINPRQREKKERRDLNMYNMSQLLYLKCDFLRNKTHLNIIFVYTCKLSYDAHTVYSRCCFSRLDTQWEERLFWTWSRVGLLLRSYFLGRQPAPNFFVGYAFSFFERARDTVRFLSHTAWCFTRGVEKLIGVDAEGRPCCLDQSRDRTAEREWESERARGWNSFRKFLRERSM